MSEATVRGAPGEHFRRQVQRRAREIAVEPALIAAQILAGPEVGEGDAAAGAADHVVRLDVAVQGVGAVDGREGAAQVHADEGGLAGAEGPALLHQRGERVAGDELHRHADLVARPVGPEDAHDVRVAHVREPARFVERPLGIERRARVYRAKHLQCDFPMQLGIEGAVHGAERAAPDLADDGVRAPGVGRVLAEPRDAFDEPELLDDRGLVGRNLAFEVVPVHPLAVGYRSGDREELRIGVLVMHAPSPAPAGRLRD